MITEVLFWHNRAGCEIGHRCALFHGSCRLSSSADSMGGEVRFLLPLAPTVTVTELQQYANAASNPLISRFHWSSGHFIKNQAQPPSHLHRGSSEDESTLNQFNVEELGKLVTERGVSIEIRQEFPPYSLYQGCTICLTTVLFYTLPF